LFCEKLQNFKKDRGQTARRFEDTQLQSGRGYDKADRDKCKITEGIVNGRCETFSNPVKGETILENAYVWRMGLPDRPFYKRNFSLNFQKIEDEWLKDAELAVIGIGDSEAFHKRLNFKNLRASYE
jgi:hypothetical protein